MQPLSRRTKAFRLHDSREVTQVPELDGAEFHAKGDSRGSGLSDGTIPLGYRNGKPKVMDGIGRTAYLFDHAQYSLRQLDDVRTTPAEALTHDEERA